MSQAEDLFNKTFFLTIGRWSMIHSLRRVGQVGLPYAARKMSSEYHEFVQEITSDPDFSKLIPDPLEPANDKFSIENLTTLLTTGAIDDFQKSVDFASLVFAHSILDGAVFDYCRVTAIAAPQDWANCVAKKEYSLKRIETAPYADLLREALGHFLSNLEKKSLFKKLEFLFARCEPPAKFQPLSGYSYEGARISTLDQLRHQIIHGDTAALELPNIENDLWYLHQTCWFLMILVAQKYKFKIDPTETTKVLGRQAHKEEPL